MSKVTVQNFADELKRPVDELLAQLKDAGVSAEDASSPLSSADKLSLLNYLRKKTRGPMGASTNAGGSGSGRITMKRKETSELKLGGGRGLPSKTVSVEVRKKRVFKAPPPPQKTEEDLAREAAEAEARAARAEAEREAAAAKEAQAAEARRIEEEEARKREEAEAAAAAEAAASAEAAEKAKQEHAERLKNDPIYRAKMEAEGSRRRAEENLRRAAEAKNAAPEPAATPAGPASPAKKSGGDRDRRDRQREELHVAQGKGGKRDKKRRKPTGQVRVDNAHQFEKPVAPIVREVEVPEGITVSELANRMAVKATDLIKVMMKSGVMATINQILDQDTAVLMVEELGHKAKPVTGSELEEGLIQAVEGTRHDAEEETRPPVVTIMGHVDHGKTSLLDYMRKTRVAAGEAGGITQHIGAYHVTTDKGVVTFLDTPGHAAFTRMRARGAQVTDVVILVVAGDDGVMPQTREAIQHARASGAPMVVAVTKIDKEESDITRVKNELLKEEVISEEFGGDIQIVGVSSVSGEGIDDLLDAILLQAEVLELKAAVDVPARGQVVEASIEKGRGPVATVLVREGTLKQGDVVLTGSHFGRVRAMFDEAGKPSKSAGPSIPVQVLGLSGVPSAGDDIVVVADERKARELAALRENKQRELKIAQSQAVRMEQVFARMGENEGEIKQLNLMIKADVQGSAEAIAEALRKLPSAEIRVNVLSATIGGISESDVDLALASRAIIFGFNVRADSVARKRIQDSGIDVRYYSVIYQVLDDVTAAISGLLGTELREQIVGIAEVRDVFRSSELGSIAGCLVIEGAVQRNLPIRVLRDQTVIYEGVLESLRRFKDDVQKVEAGTECGIGVKNYNDIKSGDQIECFDRIEVKRTVKAEA
tara:strand:- start:43337 stop:45982 length:2646 start_codon:yes stop_codon:yes gene_type:complete